MTLIQSRISYQPGRRLAIQGPRKNTGQPVSCDKFSRVDQLNILQINISGLSTKIVELNEDSTWWIYSCSSYIYKLYKLVCRWIQKHAWVKNISIMSGTAAPSQAIARIPKSLPRRMTTVILRKNGLCLSTTGSCPEKLLKEVTYSNFTQLSLTWLHST